MQRALVLAVVLGPWLLGCADETVNPFRVGWAQWGQNEGHTGQVSVAGQPLKRILADIEMCLVFLLVRESRRPVE